MCKPILLLSERSAASVQQQMVAALIHLCNNSRGIRCLSRSISGLTNPFVWDSSRKLQTAIE